MTANGLRMTALYGFSAACEAPPFRQTPSMRGEKCGLEAAEKHLNAVIHRGCDCFECARKPSLKTKDLFSKRAGVARTGCLGPRLVPDGQGKPADLKNRSALPFSIICLDTLPGGGSSSPNSKMQPLFLLAKPYFRVILGCEARVCGRTGKAAALPNGVGATDRKAGSRQEPVKPRPSRSVVRNPG